MVAIFTPNLIGDVVTFPPLADMTMLALTDIDRERMRTSEAWRATRQTPAMAGGSSQPAADGCVGRRSSLRSRYRSNTLQGRFAEAATFGVIVPSRLDVRFAEQRLDGVKALLPMALAALQTEAKFETLLPTIVDAGYADADAHTSRFTPKGIARAEELIPDA